MDSTTEEPRHDGSRRSLMKKAAVGGAVVWTAPLVMSAPAAFAAVSIPQETPPQTPPPDDTNLAPRGSASMSSTWEGGTYPCNVAAAGIDGLSTQANPTNGGLSYQNWNFGNPCNTNSIFHTDTGPGEWWQVDLGGPHTINKIVLYNRVDNGAATRAQNVHLVIDGNDLGAIPGTTGAWTSVTLTGSPLPVVNSQVVQLVNGTDNYFHLAEVEVWGV
jgi:hypothetical protein